MNVLTRGKFSIIEVMESVVNKAESKIKVVRRVFLSGSLGTWRMVDLALLLISFKNREASERRIGTILLLTSMNFKLLEHFGKVL